MWKLYAIGIFLGATIGLIIALFILTRPEKNFDLSEESYELKKRNNEKKKSREA